MYVSDADLTSRPKIPVHPMLIGKIRRIERGLEHTLKYNGIRLKVEKYKTVCN
jgi:hypothetical protein